MGTRDKMLTGKTGFICGQEVPIPLLPGMTLRDPRDIPRPKPQILKYMQGTRMVEDLSEKRAPHITKAHLKLLNLQRMGLKAPPESSTAVTVVDKKYGTGNPVTIEVVPGWVKNDRLVLRFFGYFKETVTDRREENYRLRRCTIYYYLEDGSIHIGEPRQDNSGITQGQFLKRHVVPSTVAKNGKTVTIEDLHVGQEVTMYGRTFHICSCDPFTRRFLLRSGIPVADDEPLPDEPIEHYRARQKRIPIRHKRDFKTMQFLKHDGKVLRFFCIWDDRGSVYGDRRPYVLHYYLADDTIEILEVAERNNGRDPFPLLLRRGRLPRETPENLLGRHAFLTSMPDSAFYHEKDLRIGSFIRVYDRDLLLHDCDEYTYQHYRTKWGLTDEDLMPVDIQEPPPVLPQNMIPPHNGFGQEKDALQNCISLIPKPLRKDFNKLMTNDGKEMCFSAHLVEDDEHKLAAADHGRRFIITYYLVDDTVQIYEPAIRNSGIVGGRFLSRYATAPKNDLSGDDYQPEDLFVGQLLYMYNRVFRLEEADEWTYKYMELHPRRFPYSHYGIVMNKISEFLASHYSTAEGQEQARKIFIEADCEGTGHLSVTEAHAAFLELGLCLAEQEVVTLMRMLGVNEEKKVSLENLFTSMGFH